MSLRIALHNHLEGEVGNSGVGRLVALGGLLLPHVVKPSQVHVEAVIA